MTTQATAPAAFRGNDMSQCNPSLPIGRTLSGNIVYFSPMTAVYQSLSSGTVLVGKPGRGKTNLLRKILGNAIDSGMIVIAIDPKNDLRELVDDYPDLMNVDVLNQSNTTLDPFFIKSMGAIDIISFLNVLMPSKKLLIDAIIPIIQDFVKRRDRSGEDLGMKDLTQYLYGHKDQGAREVGITLNLISEDSIGKVFFGNKGNSPINISRESQVITLGSLNIDANYETMAGAVSATVMYTVVYMLNQAMALNTSKHPILVAIDEFRVASASDEIIKIVDKLLVLGRSLRVATLIASQNITHISEKLSGLFANQFAFEMDIEECEEFTKRFVRKEYSKSTIARSIENLPKHYVLMVDKSREIAIMKTYKA